MATRYQYRILEQNDPLLLERAINQHAAEGWGVHSFGHVAIPPNENHEGVLGFSALMSRPHEEVPPTSPSEPRLPLRSRKLEPGTLQHELLEIIGRVVNGPGPRRSASSVGIEIMDAIDAHLDELR